MSQETDQATDLKKKKEEAEKSLTDKIKELKTPGKEIGQDAIKLLKGEITGEKFALTAIKQSLKAVAIFIPAPGGAAVSLVTGLFFGILQGGKEAQTDPLIEHENRMKNFISNKNAENYFDETQRMLNAGMNTLLEVYIDFLNDNHQKQRYQYTIGKKIEALFKECRKLQERFFGTSEPRNYVYTFPLIQRFILLYKYTIFANEAFGSEALESPQSILMKKKQLYQDIFNFIEKASKAIADDRQEDIKLKHHRKCAYYEIVLRDEKNVRVLPWIMSWHLEKPWKELDSVVEGTAKDTARVIVIEQCLRSTIFQVRELYKLDAALFAKAVLDATTEEAEAKQKGGQSPEDIKKLTEKRELYTKHFEPASKLDFTEEYKRVVKAEYEKLAGRYYFTLTSTGGGREDTTRNIEMTQRQIRASEPSPEVLQVWKDRGIDPDVFLLRTERYDFGSLFLPIEKEMILAWHKGGWEKWVSLDEPNKETEFHLRDKDGKVIKY